MTLEFLPVDQACNLRCTYCYENPIRDAGNTVGSKLDVEKMLETGKKQGVSGVLFGGEPLLLSLENLEKFFAAGHNGIQTNGSLITNQHIELLQKYNVHVGFSIDGPGELNDARFVKNIPTTRIMTERSITALEELLRIKHPTSLIITVHKLNASPGRLERLIEWLEKLANLGLKSARLHVLELDGDVEDLCLSNRQGKLAYWQLYKFHKRSTLKFDMFSEMRDLLLGNEQHASCVWLGCDPYTTTAVQGVGPDGSLGNCGRVNKDGVNYRKSDTGGSERFQVLVSTSYKDGGCKGCRFLFACRGYCPGTAIDNDWRNRSRDCDLLTFIFRLLESELLKEGKKPLSLDYNETSTRINPFILNEVHHSDSPHIDYEHTNVAHGDFERIGVIRVGR